MRIRLRSTRNRRRNWTDRIGQTLIGTAREPLTPAQVVHRAMAIVALLLPYVVWSHGPALIQCMKSQQGRLEARKAEELRLNGRSDAALCVLMAAYNKTPRVIEIVRGIAWAAAPSFPMQAKHFIDKLNDANAATTEDRLLQASVLMRLEQPAEAASIFQALVNSQPNNPDVWRAWGMTCHERGEYSEAMKAYRHVVALVPHDLQANTGMAELLMRSGAAPDEKSAVGLLLTQLKRAVGGKLPIATDLADTLVRRSVIDSLQRTELASLLRRMPDPKSEHLVAAVYLSYPNEPTAEQGRARRAELQTFLATHHDLDFEARKNVAQLLQKKSEHSLVLDWITMADAAGDPVLFSQRLDALMTCGLWKEAAEMAEEPSAGDVEEKQPWLHSFSVLRSCTESKTMAENMLTQSLAEAESGSHSTACNAIGFAALDYGLYPLASHAFSKAIEAGSDSVSPLKEYLHAARRSGETASDVVKVVNKLAKADRAEEATQEQSIYLRLLCGLEIERAALDLDQLRQRNADEPFLKFLNAFMRYRHGDFAGAVKALLPLPAHRWHQGETVVISTMLAAGGQVRQAAQLASKITGEGVFPEEKQMLDGWQSRATVDPTLLSSVTVAP